MLFNSEKVQLPRDPNLTDTCNLFLKSRSLPGLLLFIAGAVLLMGIITAEIFYPAGYTTAHSEISDLGATRPPDSISFQPSASIFNTTMIIGGLLILAASLILFWTKTKWYIVLFFALVGTGILGVGLFPGDNVFFHPLFALLTFISGGLAAIVSFEMTHPPFAYLLGLLGVITLFFLFFSPVFIPILGDGGTERFVAYPLIIWMIGLGGYLIGKSG
ncbi:MAG TPA: DUF998 domain-containing protein [Methanolinea sp.]|nr:DUF998 domain-containing protein [Methanolinea sp.]